jgi:hypothetical protein
MKTHTLLSDLGIPKNKNASRKKSNKECPQSNHMNIYVILFATVFLFFMFFINTQFDKIKESAGKTIISIIFIKVLSKYF